MKELHSLIEKLNNNDPLAFDEIYKRCSGHVAFVCHKFCGSKEDAEEVVQDTFLIAFKKAGTLKSETFMGYLRKIAIHESLRKRNENLRLQNYVVSVDEQTENIPELNTIFLPEQHLQDKENRAELLRIIKSLPKIQWEMVYMYYYADFSTKEISILYDCSESNVYNTLRRARKAIKSKLEGMGKKAVVKGMALLPLAALFFMEEEIFAASYIPAAVQSIAEVGIAEITAVAGEITSAAATSIKGYAIVASVVAVCTVSAVLYFALRPTVEEYPVYEPYEPAYEIYTPYKEPDDTIEDTPYEEPDDITDEIAEETEPPPYVADEPEQAQEEITPDVLLEEQEEITPDVLPEEPAAIVEEPAEEPEPHIEEELLEEPLEEELLEEELLEEEPYEPMPDTTPEPEPIEEPEPIHVDRTAEIMASLAVATTSEAVNSIINYYGFTFSNQIQIPTDGLLRFYTANEGSGYILIGTRINDDGTGWHMRFELYSNGQRPLDTRELFRWMEE